MAANAAKEATVNAADKDSQYRRKDSQFRDRWGWVVRFGMRDWAWEGEDEGGCQSYDIRESWAITRGRFGLPDYPSTPERERENFKRAIFFWILIGY